MNNRTFSLIISSFLLLSVFVSFVFGRLIIERSLESYSTGIESLLEANLDNLALTVRNDLLNENIRLAKIVFEKNMFEGSFTAYAIYKDGILIEKSEKYDRIISSVERKKYIKEIRFSEFGKQWGYVEFLNSQKYKIDFITSLRMKLLLALLVLAFINLSFIIAILYFLNKTSTAFLAIVSGSEYIIQNKVYAMVVSLWAPFLQKLKLNLETLKKLEIQNLQLQKQEDMSTLARQIAHDIRSPLSALNIAVSRMANISPDLLSIFKDSVKRINEIANQLLSASKTISKSSSREIQNLSAEVHSILNLTVGEKKLNVDGIKKIAFIKDYGNKPVFVKADATEFQRMISNLINNSIEAIEDGGIITIAVRDYRNKVQISITDDGKGIPEHVLEKIGEKNFSFGKEKIESAGSGLGVFHAKNLVNSYGGQFVINSKLNIGTMIIMTFDTCADE